MAAPTYPASADLVEGTGTRSFSAVSTSAGDYLVVEVISEQNTAGDTYPPSGGGLTYTGRTDAGTGGGHCRVLQFTAPDASGGSRTVTITPSDPTRNYRARVTVVRGSDGPSGTGTSLTAQTTSVTRNGANSGIFMAVGDWAAGSVGTPSWTPGGSTAASQQGSGATYIFGRWDDSGSAGTASHGISSPSYSTPSIAVLEMLGTTSSSVPYNPQRATPVRDIGEAWWIQRDRRDANTVGSAANPLVSPLDSAWQASGAYWHLYNDSATWSRRLYPVRRNYVSEPSLLSTAELEGALLGGADDLRRHAAAAMYTDRREVPQQRAYISELGLLSTAELENELLGSADDLRRHGHAAAYVNRRLVPQQRNYVSEPTLLSTAELENELLGGADLLRRTFTPATHVDRREVPQQRPYISDPSFYPTVTPTDPLTLAYGAGGTYWVLYNTAALTVSRRLVPQQRSYISEPGLLLTALLEDALLGAADDLRRHFGAAYYDRREVPQQRSYTNPPSTALLEDVLLGGADDRQRHAAWYTDRRQAGQQRSSPDLGFLAEVPVLYTDPTVRLNSAYQPRPKVPAQPLRWTVYFDAGPGSPPLTLAWGAGGGYWHRYHQAASLASRTWRSLAVLYLATPAVDANALSAAAVAAVVASTAAASTAYTSAATVISSASSAPTVSDG